MKYYKTETDKADSYLLIDTNVIFETIGLTK